MTYSKIIISIKSYVIKVTLNRSIGQFAITSKLTAHYWSLKLVNENLTRRTDVCKTETTHAGKTSPICRCLIYCTPARDNILHFSYGTLSTIYLVCVQAAGCRAYIIAGRGQWRAKLKELKKPAGKGVSGKSCALYNNVFWILIIPSKL